MTLKKIIDLVEKRYEKAIFLRSIMNIISMFPIDTLINMIQKNELEIMDKVINEIGID
jgi:hypothetical protein